ncbi:hypothetical protein F4678DRAFT_447463 [Xylaria arbuscula]|nr:hypothetical protein F4678DRAFT_447463 [Xylaria arbuscula]
MATTIRDGRRRRRRRGKNMTIEMITTSTITKTMIASAATAIIATMIYYTEAGVHRFAWVDLGLVGWLFVLFIFVTVIQGRYWSDLTQVFVPRQAGRHCTTTSHNTHWQHTAHSTRDYLNTYLSNHLGRYPEYPK